MDDSLDVVVLAAGKGTRMRSRRPKVLHPLAGLPLLEHVLRAAFSLCPRRVVVVVGHGADEVREAFSARGVRFVDQGEPRGTGHAVLSAQAEVSAQRFLVLPGDVPLVPPEALRALLRCHRERRATVSLLTASPPDPGPYGRVVRTEDGRPVRVVEAADASPAELSVGEVNSGIWCLENVPDLWRALAALSTANAKGELYLTDLVAHFAPAGRAAALRWPCPDDLRARTRSSSPGPTSWAGPRSGGSARSARGRSSGPTLPSSPRSTSGRARWWAATARECRTTLAGTPCSARSSKHVWRSGRRRSESAAGRVAMSRISASCSG
ncbi:MAG: NTP transferase domain-containing protein [Candidatus Acetothermia bacterium]|jgi:CTP:molybdopterin cytidylyltransferase MocA|nr:NTP transferase domain-containing protein [Candidatus Acetothermia bacterium]